MFQDVDKTCREMELSIEIDPQISWLKMRNMEFYNCKLMSRVYENENVESGNMTAEFKSVI